MSGPGMARRAWEILAASAIFVGVLVVIDAGALHQPELTLSLVPFAFLLVAALVRLSATRVVLWIAGVAVLSVTLRDARYLGLAVPSVLLGLLVLVRDRRRART